MLPYDNILQLWEEVQEGEKMRGCIGILWAGEGWRMEILPPPNLPLKGEEKD
jgi:hypothetical protein